ncbi:MAG: AAA family ATPase [Deltaproteobacteria bacterium]|nr:AAA family ATPase [Deltaproteobacteria bacterium]
MSYNNLRQISNDLLDEVRTLSFIRHEIYDNLEPPKQKTVIVKGPRGIGKTTAIMQFMAAKRDQGKTVLYLSADSVYLSDSLDNVVMKFNSGGGEYLAVDEIHKYPEWDRYVKSILDSFPKIKLITSGSSSLSIEQKSVDLSRRHLMFNARGMSFREYILMNYQIDVKAFTLEQIIDDHEDISYGVLSKLKGEKIDIIDLFHLYLREGYFPSRVDYQSVGHYYQSLLNALAKVIEEDIFLSCNGVDKQSLQNMKRLLRHISSKCPFTPNISELSRSLSIANDNTLKKYLLILSDADVLRNLYRQDKSHKDFPRPEKIFLENTNYMYAHSDDTDIGNVRETFVANALSKNHSITAPRQGDILVEDKYLFEVGGRGKKQTQIKKISRAYIVADNILQGNKKKISLWVLGLMW